VRVYIAGKIDLKNMNKTRKRFETVQKRLEELGFDVYNPAAYELGNGFSREELAERDFRALDEADVLFVFTNEMSLGTMIELGYFITKKRITGKAYKFTTMHDFMKNYSPITYPVDLITNNLDEGIEFLKKVFS